MREQAGAQIRSPRGAATSSETPTTSRTTAVLRPSGRQGPVYLTAAWAPRLPVLLPLPSPQQFPAGPTDLRGTGAKRDITHCVEAAAVAAVTATPGGTDTAAATAPSGRFPGQSSGAGARPARAPARKEIAPRPRAEGGGSEGGGQQRGGQRGRPPGPGRF